MMPRSYLMELYLNCILSLNSKIISFGRNILMGTWKEALVGLTFFTCTAIVVDWWNSRNRTGVLLEHTGEEGGFWVSLLQFDGSILSDGYIVVGTNPCALHQCIDHFLRCAGPPSRRRSWENSSVSQANIDNNEMDVTPHCSWLKLIC